MVITTLDELLFEFIAEPVMALPPVVLPLTFALPLCAVCEFIFVTLMLLLLLELELLLDMLLIVFIEPGPVLLIDAVPNPLPMPLQLQPPPVLRTLTDVLLLLWFEALPLIALPPKVLPETLAEPLVAFWPLVFRTLNIFMLKCCAFELLLLWIELNEPGPVVLMLAADARPLIPMQPAVAKLAANTLNRVVVLPISIYSFDC